MCDEFNIFYYTPEIRLYFVLWIIWIFAIILLYFLLVIFLILLFLFLCLINSIFNITHLKYAHWIFAFLFCEFWFAKNNIPSTRNIIVFIRIHLALLIFVCFCQDLVWWTWALTLCFKVSFCFFSNSWCDLYLLRHLYIWY